MGFESFNLALCGAPRKTFGNPLNLRIACQSNLSLYRFGFDVPGTIDLLPEVVAERIGDRFRN